MIPLHCLPLVGIRYVKFIGGIRPDQSGGSAADCIDCLFEEIPGKTIEEILGWPLDRMGELVSAHGATRRVFQVPAHFIPILRIGMLFQGREPVGQLPANERVLRITVTDRGLVYPAAAMMDADPYHGIPQRLPLEESEYPGVSTTCPDSTFFPYRDFATNILFLFPRILLYAKFFAVSGRLADLFAQEPWDLAKHRILSFGTSKNGLHTARSDAGWHVAMRPGYPVGLCRLMAILALHPPAHRAANGVWSHQLVRHQAAHGAPLTRHPHACLPFTGTPADPLVLSIRGWILGEVRQPGAPRIMLVTGIGSVEEPACIPHIFLIRAKGGTSHDSTTTDQRRSVMQVQRTESAPRDAEAFSTADAQAQGGIYREREFDDFFVSSKPIQPQRTSSGISSPKIRVGGQIHPTGTEVSAGKSTSRPGAKTRVDIDMLPSPATPQAVQPILDWLAARELIHQWECVAPVDRWQQHQGNPRQFVLLSPGEVAFRTDPPPPFRGIPHQRTLHDPGAPHVPRTALAVRIVGKIPCVIVDFARRPTETFMSLVVTGDLNMRRLSHLIMHAGALEGRHLQEQLPERMPDLAGRVFAIRHSTGPSRGISKRMLARALHRYGILLKKIPKKSELED